ncbi:hypothetical protein EPUS_06568 [Endocarpon pusillum Z07020]|uniref:Uncharacterized protein n=1 Tax=Endocarpon pusillum (strain Z07020 / HMAS-L-300199) TaxID=1263415 RepID=U1G6V0_ENDPU|nr:uncharacterized protein EPUS_06568 [Endocarpon pusillum Z07020]ERF73107.1 hypothetical protein EPUS_06568 [Endocarpon pusillum Z07020]
MTDYGKLKVTELKEELKKRSIPLTKLKVKQDYIDRLLEADAADKASNSPAATTTVGDQATSAPNVAAQDDDKAAAEEAAPSQKDEVVDDQPATENVQVSEGGPGKSAADRDGPNEKNDVVDAESQSIPATAFQDTIMMSAPSATPVEDRTSEPQSQITEAAGNVRDSSSAGPTEQPTSHSSSGRVNTPQSQLARASTTSTPSSGPVPSAEFLEDSRKRKRRSFTPPPSTDEVAQKRAKAGDGSPRSTPKEESTAGDVSQPPEDVVSNGHELQERAMEEAPRIEEGVYSQSQVQPSERDRKVEHKVGRSSASRSPIRRARSQQEDDHLPDARQEEQRSLPKSTARSKPHSPNLLKRRSPSPPKLPTNEDRVVTPALHAATSSLYIRNFKRPLHIPSLRSHISAVAASPNTDATNDSITSFYLDSIRTHAFVAFGSIAAASRARSALHDSRFPDEKTREPLWVDFVPDEKVEEWIETEQQATGGGRIGRRWEVVYEDSPDGVGAVLQEVGSSSTSRLAAQRRTSTSIDRREPDVSGTSATIAGVHPDRARLVPSEDNVPQRRVSTLPQEQRPEQTGTGFRALDDLFPSTTAKPKLYYKPADPRIAEERLDMIKDLRSLAGAKSGDPDMKRYSFELDRGREEWVDKGPEFGFGPRGRAVERGTRGVYRGRGGIGRGSDTWRSGGRY